MTNDLFRFDHVSCFHIFESDTHTELHVLCASCSAFYVRPKNHDTSSTDRWRAKTQNWFAINACWCFFCKKKSAEWLMCVHCRFATLLYTPYSSSMPLACTYPLFPEHWHWKKWKTTVKRWNWYINNCQYVAIFNTSCIICWLLAVATYLLALWIEKNKWALHTYKCVEYSRKS